MASISYQPWYRGQTYPSWDIPLSTDAGPDDLTGVDVTKFVMLFRSSSGVDTTGTGTFSIKTVAPAEILYKPSTLDVGSVFVGSLIIKCGFPPSNGTGDEVIYDPIPFAITDD